MEKEGIRETLIFAVANSRIVMTGDVPKKKAGLNKCFGKREVPYSLFVKTRLSLNLALKKRLMPRFCSKRYEFFREIGHQNLASIMHVRINGSCSHVCQNGEDVKFRLIFCNNFDPNLSIDFLCSCCTIQGPIAKQTPLFVLGDVCIEVCE